MVCQREYNKGNIENALKETLVRGSDRKAINWGKSPWRHRLRAQPAESDSQATLRSRRSEPDRRSSTSASAGHVSRTARGMR